MTDLSGLVAALRALLPTGTAVAGADTTRRHPLLPGEGLARATPERLREYAAGRAAARLAMAELGLPATAIPMARDRAPVWPAGLAGSISHSGSVALAAVSRDLRGVGIDIEPATGLDDDLWDTILTVEEAEILRALPDPGLAAKRVFCAKEAAYKAQYALSGTLFDFDALVITGTATRIATFQRGYPPFRPGDRLTGAQREADGHILTAFWL